NIGHRNQLVRPHVKSFGQAAHSIRLVIGGYGPHIAPAVLLGDRGKHAHGALTQGASIAARRQHPYDTAVAKHDEVLVQPATDINRIAVEGVSHVALPGSIQRFDQDTIIRERWQRYFGMFESASLLGLGGSLAQNPSVR